MGLEAQYHLVSSNHWKDCCLMNMAGKLKRTGSRIEVRHVAEVLAGEVMVPPIAEGES